jgi:hypothetical protein
MSVVVNLVNKGLGDHYRALVVSPLCRSKLPVWDNGCGCEGRETNRCERLNYFLRSVLNEWTTRGIDLDNSRSFGSAACHEVAQIVSICFLGQTFASICQEEDPLRASEKAPYVFQVSSSAGSILQAIGTPKPHL